MAEDTETEAQSKEFINAKVDSELKADCVEFVESDPNTSSLSHLVRKALFDTIDEDNREPQGQPEGSAIHGEAIGEMQEELRQLRALTEDLKTSVDAIEVRTREPSQEIKELKSDIFGVLPPSEEHIWKNERGEFPPAIDATEDDVAHSGSVTAIANVLGADKYEIERAIPYLREDNHRVQTAEVDGETRYFKEV